MLAGASTAGDPQQLKLSSVQRDELLSKGHMGHQTLDEAPSNNRPVLSSKGAGEQVLATSVVMPLTSKRLRQPCSRHLGSAGGSAGVQLAEEQEEAGETTLPASKRSARHKRVESQSQLQQEVEWFTAACYALRLKCAIVFTTLLLPSFHHV
jgi:uncharacterized protein YceK